MRIALILTGVVASVTAFSPSATSRVSSSLQESAVAEPEVAAAIEEDIVIEDVPSAPTSGLTMKAVRKSIDNLTKENFEESLSMLEPFLVNEAGVSIYSKSMRRIARQAKVLGTEVPASFALDAKATAARRAKQDAFIKEKEEERMAAEEVDEETETPEEDAPNEEDA